MKSKKKLIYKLHQNINQNPFKKIDQVSFRNAGIASYDYNKLKSIRAISLKGLASDQIQPDKLPSNWKQKYDLKMNMVSIKEEIQQKAQQALICNKKKIVVDKSLISMQPKKLNVRTLLKEKHFQAQRQEDQNVEIINSTQNYEALSDEEPINKDEKIKQRNQQKYDFPNPQSPRPNNRQGHSRNVSLPLINSHKQEPQNSMTFISPNKQLDMLVEEQRAKQQILRQIRLNAQQKINKQVLMSIKLKSIQNLERIARSQSEVIKIDKWKEKYNQIKNGQQMNSRQKYLSPKNLLPDIEQRLYNRDNMENTAHKIKPSHRYMELSEEQLGELQKSDIQLAKDLLYNVTISEHFPKPEEPIFSYNSSVLYRKSPDLVYENIEALNSQIQQNYQSQILAKNEFDNRDFWYSQPLKLTITQLKGKKNKHNQNLSSLPTQNDQTHNKKAKMKPNLNKKDLEPNAQTQLKQNELNNQTTSPFNYQSSWRQQNPPSPTEFKTKSKLHPKTQKVDSRHQDHSSYTVSVNLSSRKNHEPKCKINEEHNILDKIVEYGMPEEWEQKRFGDQELTDFDIFVQNQAKQADND